MRWNQGKVSSFFSYREGARGKFARKPILFGLAKASFGLIIP